LGHGDFSMKSMRKKRSLLWWQLLIGVALTDPNNMAPVFTPTNFLNFTTDTENTELFYLLSDTVILCFLLNWANQPFNPINLLLINASLLHGFPAPLSSALSLHPASFLTLCCLLYFSPFRIPNSQFRCLPFSRLYNPINLFNLYPACPVKRLPCEISVALISLGRSLFIRG